MNNRIHTSTSLCRLFLGVLFCSMLLSNNQGFAARTNPFLGDADAQYELAISYLQPGENKPNYVAAAKWFQLAAEQGHAKAQYSLALRYLYGQGVQKNQQTAVHWLSLAADQGLADAQFSLGLRYYWGQGATKDLTQAQYWFTKAARQGQPKAKEYLDKLQAKSSSQSPTKDLHDRPVSIIEKYVKIIPAAASGDETALRSKQDLEDKLTAKEILQAIQRVTANRPEIKRQNLDQQLSKNKQIIGTAEGYFIEGNRQVQNGRLTLAIDAYENSIRIAPGNAHSHRNLASAYAHTGQPEKAIESLQKSIELRPGHASKHATLGLIYHATGNNAAALTEYRTASRLNPGLGWFYPDMADIFIQQKNYAAAWKAVHQADLLGHAKERVKSRLAKYAPAAEYRPQNGSTLLLRQLVLPTRKAAEESLRELQNGIDFSRLAKKRSLKQYRRNGGYWGPFLPELLAPQFSTALENLPALAFSPIIETEVGFHILQKFPFYNDLINTN